MWRKYRSRKRVRSRSEPSNSNNNNNSIGDNEAQQQQLPPWDSVVFDFTPPVSISTSTADDDFSSGEENDEGSYHAGESEDAILNLLDSTAMEEVEADSAKEFTLFMSLPSEIQIVVFYHLSRVREIANLGATCRSLYELASTNSVWRSIAKRMWKLCKVRQWEPLDWKEYVRQQYFLYSQGTLSPWLASNIGLESPLVSCKC